MTDHSESIQNAVRDYKNLCECLIEDGTRLHKKLKTEKSEEAAQLMPLVEQSLRLLLQVIEGPLGEQLEKVRTEAEESQPQPIDPESASGQRKMPRFRKRFQLAFWAADSTKKYRGYSEDAGPTGLFIVTTHTGFQQGDKIRVKITLPDKSTVTCSGSLVWKAVVPASLRFVKRSGIGIQITHAPEQWYRLFM